MLSFAGLLLAGTLLMGQADEMQPLREATLGKWVRQVQYEGQPHRMVKNIEKDKETLSLYTVSGKLVYRHVVNYEIKLLDKVAIFEFWNLQVIVGSGGREGIRAGP